MKLCRNINQENSNIFSRNIDILCLKTANCYSFLLVAEKKCLSESAESKGWKNGDVCMINLIISHNWSLSLFEALVTLKYKISQYLFSIKNTSKSKFWNSEHMVNRFKIFHYAHFDQDKKSVRGVNSLCVVRTKFSRIFVEG